MLDPVIAASPGPSGKLIYLVGPSGSGKDSLIEAAEPHLARRGVRRARRVITRSAEAKGEQATGVSREAFDQHVREGAFALHWHANGLAYGIPAHIDTWLAQGQSVLVNGSRAHQPEAVRRYPDMITLQLQVSPEALRQRLEARGRESREDIEQRLARSTALQPLTSGAVYTLDNSGDLQDTVDALLALLKGLGITQGN